MRSRSPDTAPSSSRRCPCFETNTGSTTRLGIPTFATDSATASTISADASIPVLAASTPMSETTAVIWSATTRGSIASYLLTPSVFCTVTAVTAVIPNTPSALNVLRSAWIPAPPPESEPAIVSARGRRTGSSSMSKRLPGAEVIPSRGRELRGSAIDVDGHEPPLPGDLANVRQSHAEVLGQLGCSLRDRVGRHRREQLVVLPAREGERQGIDAQRRRAIEECRGHGNSVHDHAGPDPARITQSG